MRRRGQCVFGISLSAVIWIAGWGNVQAASLWNTLDEGDSELTHSGHSRAFIESLTPGKRDVTIPTIDFSGATERHVVIASGSDGQRQGHANTVLMPDGVTIYVVWTAGHGGAIRFLKKSTDGGRSWSELLDVPANWDQHQNSPPLYRLPMPGGRRERLFVFAQAGPSGPMMYRATSEDGGTNWSPFELSPLADGSGFLLADVMPFTAIVSVDGGEELLGVTNIRRPGEGFPTNVIVQSRSADGGLSWTDWEVVLDLGDPFRPSEPDIIRSPNGEQLLMIIRENERSFNSWIMLSGDEGRTWSNPYQAPASITMDRHQHRYSNDGRLIIVGRDVAASSPTRRHFVAWVGTYDDLVEASEGEYRVKLLPHHGSGNVEYPSLELLSDGSFVATNSVVYEPGESYSVVATQFSMAELDHKLNQARFSPLRMKAAWELSAPTEVGRFYEVQSRDEDENWTRFEFFEGTGQTMKFYFPSDDRAIEDYRVMRTDAALEDLPVLYSTDFSGAEGSTPEGWTLRLGNTSFGSLAGNDYQFDYRFGSNNMTFLAVLDEGTASEWTDYRVSTTITTRRAEEPVQSRNIIAGLGARIPPGNTNDFYHARLRPELNWPTDWREKNRKGGLLEIYRLGGPGSGSLSSVAGMLEPDPDPDTAIHGGDLLPETSERTVTMNLTVMGENVVLSLWDADGAFMVQTATQDASFTKGAPGIRVPALRDGTITYHDFRVHDLSGVALNEEAPGLQRNPAMQLLVDAPLGSNYRIEQSADLVSWNDLEPAGEGSETEMLISISEQNRKFFRVIMEDLD